MDSKYRSLSLVIPFLNEEENMQSLCEVLDNFAADKPYKISAIFVDDGSTDMSIKILEKFTFHNVQATLIRLSKNYGSHNAMRAGVSVSDSHYTMFYYADQPEPVEFIDILYQKIEEGYDYVGVVKGSVEVNSSERLFSRLFILLMRKFASIDIPTGGVSNLMFNHKIRDNLNKNMEKNSSVTYQVLSMGYHSTFVTCALKDRAKGVSKWTTRMKIKTLIDCFVSFSFAPIRLISALGVLMAFIGFAFGLFIFIVRIFNILDMAAGWPTLISVLMLGFGVTNLSLGIIAEYIWRTMDNTRDNPTFLINEQISLKSL